jgi:hypothetical protein
MGTESMRDTGEGNQRSKVDPITFGLFALRVAVLVITIHVGTSASLTDDLSRFREIYLAPGTPYRTVPVEYAPGEVLFIKGIGSADPGLIAARLAVAAFIADIAIWAALRHGWGDRTAKCYLWISAPMLVFLYIRFDLIPVALTAWGAALAVRGSQRSGGITFAIGILSKLWPAIVAPAFWISGRRRAFVWAICTSVAGSVAWVAFAGVSGVGQVLTFRHASGWGVQSIVGTVVWITSGGPVQIEAGSPRIGTALISARLALAVLLAVLLVAIWAKATRLRRDAFGPASVAAVGALLACSPLFSPQFACWLLPWAAISSVHEDQRFVRCVALIAALSALLFVVYSPHRAALSQLVLVCMDAAILALPLLWLLPRRRRAAVDVSSSSAPS